MKKQTIKNIFNKKNLPFILLFILGFSVMLYPVVSNLYYRTSSGAEIQHFDDQAEKLAKEDIDRRMNLARAYNSTLDPSKMVDSFSKEEKEQGVAEYARMLQLKELIGHVEVPKINQDLPIYAGTSDEVLERGAGHLEGSSLPIGGPSTHTVITAHRGLPKAKLFRNLDKLKEGDIFYVRNLKETLAYEVDQKMIVKPNYFEPVMVVEGQDYATLLTCHPYMINSHRLLVRGHRVPYDPKKHEKDLKDMWKVYLPYISVALIVVALLLTAYVRHRWKRKKKRMKADG